jgi:hypothetical protein
MISRARYLGSDPKFQKALFKTAIWDFFDIVKGTIKLQFDDLKLEELAHGWHEVPLDDVVIETEFDDG